MCGGFSGDNEAAQEKVGQQLSDHERSRAPLPQDLRQWQPQIIKVDDGGDEPQSGPDVND